MFKQIFITVFGMILVTTFVHGVPFLERSEDSDKEFPYDDNESFDSNHLLQRFARSGTSDQQKFQKQMLDAHNAYRKCHRAPALTLDDKLNTDAQAYAERIARRQSLDHSSQSERPNSGENLYRSFGKGNLDGKAPTDLWYKEYKDYNFNQPGFSGATGHFTQLVWKNSQRLGVGIAYNGNSAYVVARYSPPGNVQGQYQQNVFPSQC